jgi:ubiquinone/menaquinone biosynthesis C-methylase UbiE
MESQAESSRLEQKTDARESWRELTLTGLREGMTGLDAGGATGAVGRVMAQVVGPQGHIQVWDQSLDRLAHGQKLASGEGLANISFVGRDLEQAHQGAPLFDYVWCRFVFEYLRAPDLVLQNLIQATHIGGRVVVGDLDNNGLLHYPMVPELEAGLARVMKVLEGHFDPWAGRKLFSRFRQAGLEDIEVQIVPYHVYAGAIPEDALPNWRQKFEVIRPRAVAAFSDAAAYDQFVSLFLENLQSPDTFTYGTLILVSGKRVR